MPGTASEVTETKLSISVPFSGRLVENLASVSSSLFTGRTLFVFYHEALLAPINFMAKLDAVGLSCSLLLELLLSVPEITTSGFLTFSKWKEPVIVFSVFLTFLP